ncbi:t-SNARE [Pleurotus eryngii]|uniref:t-SNARE n=1 Tax=Pleurotus eryngii TaxID=5323 RepID=A0A9P5ZKU8_PLEER|nr:t-SNARE [Pleurotus eryngii]
MAYTSEDPYNAVQEEIENSLQAARTLCSSYVRIRGYASTEEEKEAREELQTSLDLLEVDLDDLDESVRIVETAEGARSFGLADAEVQERRQYVRKVKKEIELMRSRLTTSVDQHPLSPSPNSWPSNTAPHPLASTSRVHSRAGSLNASLGGSRAASPRPEDDQAEWSRVEQQMLIEQQDRTMDSIAGTLSTLAQQAGLMGREINEHVE